MTATDPKGKGGLRAVPAPPETFEEGFWRSAFDDRDFQSKVMPGPVRDAYERFVRSLPLTLFADGPRPLTLESLAHARAMALAAALGGHLPEILAQAHAADPCRVLGPVQRAWRHPRLARRRVLRIRRHAMREMRACLAVALTPRDTWTPAAKRRERGLLRALRRFHARQGTTVPATRGMAWTVMEAMARDIRLVLRLPYDLG
jgi:hypothetical protein